MHDVLRPLAGHAVFLLLVQLTLLLVVARLGAELSKRLGLPAVVGELAAGIALGPSLFGRVAPHWFAAVFPPDPAQFHLLDVVGNLGMVLLLLLTGLETDLRLLKNLGRAALIASGTGMVVPFVLGFGLGLVLPDHYLGEGGRVLFSLFLATTMSISAMPVIAKILMDLDLTRRNIGLVILSAGVVDDTSGWIILSLIAGAATHGGIGPDQLAALLRTLALTAAFLVAAAFLVYPALRFLVRMASERARTHDSDLVLVIATTFLCAAVTDRIGIHAVFGAFVVGTLFRQVPSLRPETLHRLEGFVFAVLAPVFFGIVGLKVDLGTLGDGKVLGLVLLVACVGKLVGVTVGGLWGGLRFWEASSIAVAMNARGAMGLVAATIGLALGILNQVMFSVIVVMAVATSFMAPLALRLTVRRVRMTDEEAQRIEAEQARGVFDPERVRVLVPTAGGPNALGAARLAFALAKKSVHPVGVLYVEAKASLWERVRRRFVPNPAGRGLEQHLAAIKSTAGTDRPPEIRRAVSPDVARAITEEAARGYDLIVIGASQHGVSLGGDVLADVVTRAHCHVAIVKTTDGVEGFKHVLVPIDGGLVSRVAVEFAARYAALAGADLTLAVLTEHRPQAAAYTDDLGDGDDGGESTRPISADELERISRVFKSAAVKPTILNMEYDPSSSAVADAVASGKYDLVVLGAENRAIQHRLFFGYDSERLIRHSPVSLVVLVPSIARLAK